MSKTWVRNGIIIGLRCSGETDKQMGSHRYWKSRIQGMTGRFHVLRTVLLFCSALCTSLTAASEQWKRAVAKRWSCSAVEETIILLVHWGFCSFSSFTSWNALCWLCRQCTIHKWNNLQSFSTATRSTAKHETPFCSGRLRVTVPFSSLTGVSPLLNPPERAWFSDYCLELKSPLVILPSVSPGGQEQQHRHRTSFSVPLTLMAAAN